MDLRLLQLNIYKGRLLESLENYLLKEDFDILTFQEVTGHLAGFVDLDLFDYLKKKLDLAGELSINWNAIGDKTSYFGNAILFKRKLKVGNMQQIWLKPYREVDLNSQNWPTFPWSALSLDFQVQDKRFTVVTSHLVRGRTSEDKPYKANQAKILLNSLKNLKYPYILTGDFNLNPRTQIIGSFSSLATNLTLKAGITNTLNPRTHRVKKLFPKGIAVDYIFVSEEILVKEFKLIDSYDLSDHFGLSLTFQA